MVLARRFLREYIFTSEMVLTEPGQFLSQATLLMCHCIPSLTTTVLSVSVEREDMELNVYCLCMCCTECLLG